MTPDEVDAFLRGRHTMTLASIGADGRPHLAAMWYGFHDGAPAVWTYGRSQKVVNLRRDPRITAMVESGDTYDQLRGVELVGTARILEDRDAVLAIGRDVSDRYSGGLTVPDEILAQMGAKRVGIVIDAAKTVSWDHTKLGGGY